MTRERLLWTIAETAERLGVSSRTVQRMAARGDVSVLRIGRAVRIVPDSIELLIAGSMMLGHHGGGPWQRKKEVDVCHTKEKTHRIGGSITPIRPDIELGALLGLKTARKRSRLRPNGGLEAHQGKHWNKPPERTFDELMLRYLKDTTEKRSHDRDLLSAKRLYEAFSGRVLGTLRGADIHAYIHRRKARVTPGTINREIGLLSAAINHARKHWDWDIENPVEGRRLREPESRTRWISRSEAFALINAAEASGPYLPELIRLALNTGMRKGRCWGWSGGG